MQPATANRRIADLKATLAARTDRDGKPKPGYKRNVGAIQAELAKLTSAPPADTSPAAASTGPAPPVVTAGVVPNAQTRPVFKPPVDSKA